MKKNTDALEIPKGWIAFVIGIALVSGFAGLGYEAIWTRLFAVSLGSEIQAVLSVLAALFAGIALGSLAFGARIKSSQKPMHWYAALEAIIALWALALIGLFPATQSLLPILLPIDASTGWQWCIAFGFAFVLLLPATLAMGGTLPALEAMLTRGVQGKAIGLAYGTNTLGAVVGTLTTAFVLLPTLGLTKTLVLCASLNALAAACAVFLPSFAAPLALEPKLQTKAGASWPLFITGLLGIGYEVVTIRVLSQILENTVYTFALLLGVYLFGTACGGLLQHRFFRQLDENKATSLLALMTCFACLGGAVMLVFASPALLFLQGLWPPSIAGRLAAEFSIATLVFLVPSLLMGTLFSQLAQMAKENLGKALFFNTLGAAFAPILFGPVLLPTLGAKACFALLAGFYVLILMPLGRRYWIASAVSLLAVAAFLIAPLSLHFTHVPEGGKLLWHRDGTMAAVSVISDRSGARYLQVNNHFRMGGDVSLRADAREAYIPLLLHPQPKRALFLGLGTGTTISAAANDPNLSTDGVELVPEVVESFPYFSQSAPHLGKADNLHIHIADARRFVQATPERYDVIVADLFHPSLEGSGALYTQEHFAAIRARLNEGGIFCQWLPLYQLDLETLRIIIRSFQAIYPDASAYLAHFSVEMPMIGLVGTNGAKSHADNWFATRINNTSFASQLGKVDLQDPASLFGLYLGGPDDLRAFAGTGPLNSDDLPLVQTLAPHFVYAPSGNTAGERLLALLEAFHPQPSAFMTANLDGEKLGRYWQARDQFLKLGVEMRSVTPGADMIAKLAPRLLEIVRISGDFDAAYNPLLIMARQLERRDPRAARQLLEALDETNPQRPEARRMLAALPPT